MKTIQLKKIASILAATLYSTAIPAQGECLFTTSARVDLVSQYIWRGSELGQTSIQPQVAVGFGWINLSIWGSSDFNGLNREIDPSLSFQLGGLSLGATGYWASDSLVAKYSKNHVLEGYISYTLKRFPLTLEWNTVFAGEEEKNYSSYAKLSYESEYKNWQFGLTVGAIPWKNEMLGIEKFAFTDITAYVGRSISLAFEFKLEGALTLTYNPHFDHMFWTVGVGLVFE